MTYLFALLSRIAAFFSKSKAFFGAFFKNMGALLPKTKQDFAYIYTLFVFILYPVYIRSYSDVSTFKMSLYIFVSVTFFGFILVFPNKKNGLLHPHKHRRFSATTTFALLYCVAILFSCLFSPYGFFTNFDRFFNGASRYDGLMLVSLYLLTYFLISRYGSFSLTLTNCLSVVLCFMSVVGVVQMNGYNIFRLYPYNTKSMTMKYDQFASTIGNIDILAGFLCAAIPMVFVAYIVKKARNTDIIFNPLYILGYVSSLFLLLETGVSSGKVGVCLAAAIVFPFLFTSRARMLRCCDMLIATITAIGLSQALEFKYNKSDSFTERIWTFSDFTMLLIVFAVIILAVRLTLTLFVKKYPRKAVFWTVAALEAAVVITGVVYFKFIYEVKSAEGLVDEIGRFLQGKLSIWSGSHRIAIWMASERIFQEYPAFGCGYSVFVDAFKEHSLKYYNDLLNRSSIADYAHNDFIQIACTTGLFGLLSYLGMLGSTFVSAIRRMKYNPEILICIAAVIGYLGQVFFSFNIILVAPYFWCSLAMLEASIRRSYSDGYPMI